MKIDIKQFEETINSININIIESLTKEIQHFFTPCVQYFSLDDVRCKKCDDFELCKKIHNSTK